MAPLGREARLHRVAPMNLPKRGGSFWIIGLQLHGPFQLGNLFGERLGLLRGRERSVLLRLAKRLASSAEQMPTDNHRQRQSLGHLERYPVAFRGEPDECGQKRGQRRGQHRVGGCAG